MYIEGDLPNIVTTNGNNGNNSGWNDWSWIIGLAIIGALFGGFGGNGGFGGGNRGGFGGFCLGGAPATQADLAAGFNNSAVLSSLNDIKLTQASNLNFINQGFAGLNNVINQGFAGVDNAICTLGYQNQAGFNAIGSQLASCCCDLRQQISDCCCRVERGIDGVNYNMAKNTCDIIRASQDNTRAILDFLTNEKIEGLRAENTALKGQISNDRQTRTIVNELRDGCPVPAYLTCNPKAPYGYGYPYGFNNGGCGCGASVQ